MCACACVCGVLSTYSLNSLASRACLLPRSRPGDWTVLFYQAINAYRRSMEMNRADNEFGCYAMLNILTLEILVHERPVDELLKDAAATYSEVGRGCCLSFACVVHGRVRLPVPLMGCVWDVLLHSHAWRVHVRAGLVLLRHAYLPYGSGSCGHHPS